MDEYADIMSKAFEDELQKIAEARGGSILSNVPGNWKTIGLIGAGMLGGEALRRAERDRRMGRAMRLQQGSYGY